MEAIFAGAFCFLVSLARNLQKTNKGEMYKIQINCCKGDGRLKEEGCVYYRRGISELCGPGDVSQLMCFETR